MTLPPLSPSEAEAAKRALRAELGRLRRRIDRRLEATGGELHSLVSWQTHARRHPLWTIGLGLGAGWLIAGGWTRSGLLRLATGELGKVAALVARDRALGELASLWQAASRSRNG